MTSRLITSEEKMDTYATGCRSAKHPKSTSIITALPIGLFSYLQIAVSSFLHFLTDKFPLSPHMCLCLRL